MQDYLNVPIGLSIYAIKSRNIEQVRLYCCLKMMYSGKFRDTKDNRRRICSVLQYKTPATFNKHLQWLINNKWLTVNSKTNIYRIIGFVQLKNKLQIATTAGAIFEYDFKDFKAFIYASIIIYYAKNKSRKDRRAGFIMGDPSKSTKSPALSLPNRYLALILEIPHSGIVNMKNCASKANFISVKKQYESLGIPISQKENYSRAFPDRTHLLKKRNGELAIQKADSIIPNIILRYRRNFRTRL